MIRLILHEVKKLAQALRQICIIQELRTRLYNNLKYILIFLLGTHVLLPGIDPGRVLGLADDLNQKLTNIFSVGGYHIFSLFGTGISPYITASIVIHILTLLFPYFQRIKQEGQYGKNQLNQYTRLLALGLCLFWSYINVNEITRNKDILLIERYAFMGLTTCLYLTGTMACIWLSDQVTNKGIGNGTSILIMTSILSRLPASLHQEWKNCLQSRGVTFFIAELIAILFIILVLVLVTQATRRIPLQYVRQVIREKDALIRGKHHYLPLKMNTAGVMPIIAAQVFMQAPVWLSRFIPKLQESFFTKPLSWKYNLVFSALILLISFVYTGLVMNTTEMSSSLKRSGAFIPGLKPGTATARYISKVLNRITLPGSLFIATVAALPALASQAGITDGFCRFCGGPSLLILVGVVLEIIQQIQGYLLIRHYDRMMKSYKLRSDRMD